MIGRRALLVHEIDGIRHDDRQDREKGFGRLHQAPVEHLVLVVRDMRQNCAAGFNERFEVVDMCGARRHTDTRQFASEHGLHDHRSNCHGKSSFPVPRQQETYRA